MSATNQNIQLKSYSWNVRTKTGVTAFFDIDMRKHVFSGQRGARLPTGCANESGKIKAKYNRGRNECKEEAVEKKNPLGVQDSDGTGEKTTVRPDASENSH